MVAEMCDMAPYLLFCVGALRRRPCSSHRTPPADSQSGHQRPPTLPRFVVETLAQHLEAYPPVDDMVWTTEQGALLRRGSFGRIWRKAVGESVGPPCRIHDLRHTHAAWLIADGEHPKAIQTRLGHGSIAVTMDRYGHLMDGLDDQIALHLDARARSAAPPARPERNRDPPDIGLLTRRNPERRRSQTCRNPRTGGGFCQGLCRRQRPVVLGR